MEKEPNTLADRIRHRLEVLRKSAAAVSLEAGLGRSAVQDILAGNSTSPRLDTIQKLTGPLQCSLSYLVGGTEIATTSKDPKQPFRDLSLLPAVRDIESGVFRARIPLEHRSFERNLEWALDKTLEEQQYPVATDLRLPKFSVFPYRLLDHSLENIGIFKGDILMAASGFGDQYDLRNGQIVIVEHSLASQNLDEWIVRVVEESDEGFRLVPKSKDPVYRSYKIPSTTFGMENAYSSGEGESVSIHAIVTSIHRELSII
ncbi:MULTISPECIES: helix-turn-helix domain-containing protein [Rhizobium]|uniref:helix-turn-helix domain-containing protein n=1 Tax=Rhizobium TaxID=379 RepID=UPI001C835572|nr:MULTISPECIES: helix-turn-helix domain-containing protein [Rhizobium]MBX4952079.1 helix-turn-helix transcriptional regulator [Rhizobium binae]MBX5226858.1 helix-turn-helix transcriptional regulator [Rhizobium sp. NLR9b]MBX5238180.1 helix-turn-helix transcriptional regulator [Rhizobium sp. NLR22b]MBX5276101.1 helix-turn-helix transcriptional regulator [Rhizobium sp. NLR13a]MBX5287529.1 helix-turn-helix transcriptional regulator [Rhizobium sp. NLR10b]